MATVGTIMTASTMAGTIVQPISSRVLPWICGGIRSRPLRCRYLMTIHRMPPSTSTNTGTAPNQKTFSNRFFGSRAKGPAGFRESCDACGAHAAKRSGEGQQAEDRHDLLPHVAQASDGRLWGLQQGTGRTVPPFSCVPE